MDNTSNTLTFLSDLATVPNVPFLPKPRINYLTELFSRHKITYTQNAYSIIVESNSTPGASKLVFMTHLDHPGIALRTATRGKFFGSAGFVTIGTERLHEFLKDKPAPLAIFDTEGNFAGKGKLVGVSTDARQDVQIETSVEVKPNYMAQWEMPWYEEKADHVYVYSADNDVPTAAMLSLILNPQHSSDWHIVYVFNFFEEAHQISSYQLAKQNMLGLTAKDFVVNLECKEIFIGEREIVNGVVLQLGESGCVYGYKFTEPNLAELAFETIAAEQKIKLITGITKGSCDARSFSNFKLTPNIVTLAVPNKFKHNTGENNEIVQEKIAKQDITDLEQLMRAIVHTKPGEVSKNGTDKKGQAFEYKRAAETPSNSTNKTLMKHKKVLNNRLALAYKRVIKEQKPYPDNFRSTILDGIYKALSYARYIFDILTLNA